VADNTPEKTPFGRPSLYNPKFCETIMKCGQDGMSVAEMAKACGVAKDTIYQWVKAHEDFSDAFTRAKALSQSWWEEQARLGLYTRDGVSLNSGLWSRSMAARFPEDYTEKKQLEHSGGVQINVIDAYNDPE
jgi:predicted DNA-binding protein YlxM (UPF0122 family)